MLWVDVDTVLMVVNGTIFMLVLKWNQIIFLFKRCGRYEYHDAGKRQEHDWVVAKKKTGWL